MSLYVHLYDKVLKEHRQDLQDEAHQQHLVACIPHHRNFGRHAISALGVKLMALGSWMEKFDRQSESFVYE